MRVFGDSATTGRQRKATRNYNHPEALWSAQIDASQAWEQVNTER